jgi:predicted PurR-regulated permease PerM
MQDKLARNSFLLSVLGVTVLFGAILLPFSGAILWAVVVAIVLHPLQARCMRRFDINKNVLTLMVLTICTVIIILPLLGVAIVLAQEGTAIYDQIQSGAINPVGYIQQNVVPPLQLQHLMDRLGINVTPLSQLLKNAVTQSGQYLAKHALNFGQNTAQFFE